METKVSKCMYCGSHNYGNGCIYSPSKLHVHIDDPNKCIYCGSKNFGNGCIYNKRKIHVHGIEYNDMLKDSVKNTITFGYLIERLSSPIEETHAFKIGLIDSNFNLTRFPTSDEDKLAYTPLDAYIFKIKKMLGPKIDLLNNEVIFEKMKNEKGSLLNEEKIKKYEVELKLKERMNKCVLEMYDIFDDGFQNGIEMDVIERILLESFTPTINV